MTLKQFVKKYKQHGSLKSVARQEGMTWYAVRKLYLQACAEELMQPLPVGRKTKQQSKTPEPTMEGRVEALETTAFSVPKRGVKRYLFTSAQNNTPVHLGLWENLLALAAHYSATVQVARFTYMKSGLGASGDKALFHKGVKVASLLEGDTLVWDSALKPYLNDERMEVAPGLIWCGEQNILPTAVRPLSGYETYTGRASGIFPHVKFCMNSVPSGKFEPTKFNFTTGTVTQRNYIQRKAGLKAEFHHGYGALLVEVDSNGDWWCRQINGDSDGTIYDLDVRAKDGKVTTGHRVEAITWGDLHVMGINKAVVKMAGDMMDALNPRHAFYHDILDFRSRNHHDQRDPFKMLEKHVRGQEDVQEEVDEAMEYIANRADRWPDTYHVVVDSNHDRAMERWLRESDWRLDPVNMEFYMKSCLAKIQAIWQQDEEFHMMRHWWNHNTPGRAFENVQFLDEDESFILCHDKQGGIEGGMHGHLGPNGRFGSPAGFAKMGRRANTAHTHQAGIHDGVYVAGCSCDLDQGYNRGPSSWSWTHTLTYENGKRALVTMWNGKWRA